MFANRCIIFDVDGVLIDTRLSYNRAIKKTVNYIVRYFAPALSSNTLVTNDMIFNFRQSGNFNNDVDTAYALCLSIICNPRTKSELPNFITEVTARATYGGIRSVEDYLSSVNPNQLDFIKTKLKYPNRITKSILTRIFDEYFYGALLFKRRHGISAEHHFGKPLIYYDRPIVIQVVLQEISKLFSERLALITGRSKLASQYSLGNLYSMFSQKASVYLEDEGRYLGKPNPYSLKKTLDVFSCTEGFYVGDSPEDLIMCKNLNSIDDYNVEFIGVYGAAVHPKRIKEYFLGENCLIVKNVNELSNILYKVRNKL
jgi:phosphoglycolate phosphatase-like HAD superfamily hydrolase